MVAAATASVTIATATATTGGARAKFCSMSEAMHITGLTAAAKSNLVKGSRSFTSP